jgi:hypothetical protein
MFSRTALTISLTLSFLQYKIVYLLTENKIIIKNYKKITD